MWLDIIKLALPEWNRRVLAEEDFHAFCNDEHLKVVEAETGEYGLYIVHRGQPFIVLDPSLQGMMRLWVEWHEAAHHLLHIPAPDLFRVENSKEQWQANVVAACAMIPQPLLRRVTIEEIRVDYGYPKALCNIRLAVFERYRF